MAKNLVENLVTITYCIFPELCYTIIREREKKGEKKMTTQEMKNRIAELEERIFSLAMKDRWFAADFNLDAEMNKELRELKKAIAE